VVAAAARNNGTATRAKHTHTLSDANDARREGGIFAAQRGGGTVYRTLPLSFNNFSGRIYRGKSSSLTRHKKRRSQFTTWYVTDSGSNQQYGGNSVSRYDNA